MEQKSIVNISRIHFLLTIVVCLFWITGNKTNVYKFSVIGGFFEILSLPMLGLALGLPILAIFLIFKNRGADKLWPVISLFIGGVAILFLSL